MNVFISYATANRRTGAAVKKCCDECDLASFLAHEDLQVSEVWRQRILEELQKCHIFIALLSTEFKASDWTSQEIGVVVSRPEVLIIPLSIDGTLPFGFIGHIQAKRINHPEIIPGEVLSLPILQRFPEVGIDISIRSLGASGSFRTAEERMELLMPFVDRFTTRQIGEFAAHCISNNQIWPAGKCSTKFLPVFMEKVGDRMQPEQLTALRYQVENQRWYRPG